MTQEAEPPRPVAPLVERYGLRPPVTFAGRLDPKAARAAGSTSEERT